MKTKVAKKLIVLAFFMMLYGGITFAQETESYYRFDDNGVLSEFLQVTLDSVRIEYNGSKEYGMIKYPDGTLVDYSASLTSSFDGPRIWPNYKLINTNGALRLRDWYKNFIMNAKKAPFGSDMLNNLFGLGKVTILFPDKSQMTIDYESFGPEIKEYTDVGGNGDLVTFNDWGFVTKINQSNVIIFDLNGELVSEAKLVSGRCNDPYRYREKVNGFIISECEGQILIEEGKIINATFLVLVNGEDSSYSPKSPYLVNVFGGMPEDLEEKRRCIRRGGSGINGMLERICIINGSVIDNNDKIVAIYRGGQKLDDFDMASIIAAEQGKINRAKADAEKAASDRAEIINKYGNENAEAFFAGKVIVGMPWNLVEIGLVTHSFADFYCALPTAVYQTSNNERRCYSLYGEDFAYVGEIWITNGIVESISFF